MESTNLAVVCTLLQPVFDMETTNSADITTQVAAACAAISLLHEIPANLIGDESVVNTPQQQLLTAALPFAVSVLDKCLQADDMTNMSSLGEAFGRLVGARPLLFKPIWGNLLEIVRRACIGDGENSHGISEDAVKCVLLELMQDILTNRETVAFCCNQQSRDACLHVCITLLCRVQITPTMELDETYICERLPSSEDCFGDEDGEEDESCLLAASIYSTFIRKWPIEETLVHGFRAIEWLSSTDCGTLRAGLLLVSMYFDLLGPEMQQHLPAVVQHLLSLVEHENPRLRLGALLCFKSLVLSEHDDETAEGFRAQCHGIFFPTVVKSIYDNIAFPKVSCQGLNNLRSFCDPQACPQSYIQSHTQSILELAWVLLSKRGSSEIPIFLLEECVPLIGNISVIDRETFAPHYSNFMGVLSSILIADGTHQGDLQDLRGKCLECCALMGMSVGYEAFHVDAVQLLEFMISLQSDTESFDFSDPMATYIVQACARIAGVMGNTFEPYLQKVMPILLVHIAQDIEHSVLTEDQFGTQGETSDDYVTVYKRGTGNIRFFNNSHAMKEKEMSLRTLYQYLLDIPQLMIPFLEDIIKAVTSISPSHCCSEDNTSSLTIIGAIISDSCTLWLRYASMNQQASDAVGDMVTTVTTYLLSALQEANKLSMEFGNVDFSAATVDSIRLTLQILAENSLVVVAPVTNQIGRALFIGLRDQVHLWITRKYESGDDNDHLLQDEETTEDELWLGLTDTLGYLFKSMSLEDAGNLFREEVVPFFLPLMPASENSEPLLSLIISILTDAVEAFSANTNLCNTVIEMLAPLLFQHADKQDITILCMYGIGACALHGSGGEAWAPYTENATGYLQHYFNAACSGGGDEDECDDELKGTIISAMFKVAVCQNNSESLLKYVLHELLPLGCFPYEARECHMLLLDFMHRANSQLLGGSSGSNLTVLFTIVAQLAGLYMEATNLLDASSNSSNSTGGMLIMDSDNSDFWNEQLVPENFRVKVQEIFGSTSDDGGLVCGFNKSDVLSVIGTLPEELQQMLSVLLNQ